MTRTPTVVLCVGLMILPWKAAGEAAPRLAPGSRMRVTAPDFAPRPLVGRVSAVDTDAVVLKLDGLDEPIEVPRSVVTKWELSRGRHTQVRRGAGRGLIIGAAVGASLGLWASYEGDAFTSAPQGMLLGAAVFGGVFAGFGALVGLSKTERWEQVTPDGPLVDVVFLPAGVGLSVRW